jgi:hypothetical protein
MKSTIAKALAMLALLGTLVGCGSMYVKLGEPGLYDGSLLASNKVSNVVVTVNPSLDADMLQLLKEQNAAAKLETELMLALTRTGDAHATLGNLTLAVQIASLRMSPPAMSITSPSAVSVLVTVTDKTGAILRSKTASSSTTHGGRKAYRLTRIFSDVGQKVLNLL